MNASCLRSGRDEPSGTSDLQAERRVVDVREHDPDIGDAGDNALNDLVAVESHPLRPPQQFVGAALDAVPLHEVAHPIAAVAEMHGDLVAGVAALGHVASDLDAIGAGLALALADHVCPAEVAFLAGLGDDFLEALLRDAIGHRVGVGLLGVVVEELQR